MVNRLANNLIALTGSLIANALLIGGLLLLNTSTIPKENVPDTTRITIVRESSTRTQLKKDGAESQTAEMVQSEPLQIDLDYDPPPLRLLPLPDIKYVTKSSTIGPVIANPVQAANNEKMRQNDDRKLDFPLTSVSAPQPIYPSAAERARAEGWVKIKLFINEAGWVERADTLSLQGHASFQTAVENAVRQWTFRPPSANGKMIRVTATKTFYFELSDDK
jgi:TonB family protein